jgi:hypothetical protein
MAALMSLLLRLGLVAGADVLLVSATVFALYGLIPATAFPMVLLAGVSLWVACERAFYAFKRKIVLKMLFTAKSVILLIALSAYLATWLVVLHVTLAAPYAALTAGALFMPLLIVSLIVARIFMDSNVEMLPLSEIDDTYALAETIIISGNSVRREPKTGIVIARDSQVISGIVTKELKRRLAQVAKGRQMKLFSVKKGTAMAPSILLGAIFILAYVLLL